MRSGGSDTLGGLSVGKLQTERCHMPSVTVDYNEPNIFVSREMLLGGRQWPWMRRIFHCNFSMSVTRFSQVFRPIETLISKKHSQRNRITQGWECSKFFSLFLKNQLKKQSFIIMLLYFFICRFPYATPTLATIAQLFFSAITFLSSCSTKLYN